MKSSDHRKELQFYARFLRPFVERKLWKPLPPTLPALQSVLFSPSLRVQSYHSIHLPRSEVLSRGYTSRSIISSKMNTLCSSAIVGFLSFTVLFPIIVTAASSCLPLTTNSGLCAVAPGTTSSDNHDDVCVLVECCKLPAPQRPQTVELPSGVIVNCKDAVCPNVCKLSIDRIPLGGEACIDTCNCGNYTVPSTPSEVQQKLVQAAKLSSIAYCLDFMIGLPFPELFICPRFCNEFPNAVVHSVSGCPPTIFNCLLGTGL
jgi:hypothetical protein